MAIPRIDPLPAFNFIIVLLNTSSTFTKIKSSALDLAIGGFRQCSGLESTLETETYLEGGINNRVHQFPSRLTYSNIVLERGMSLGDGLWLWHKEFIEGKGTRRDGFITLMNEGRLPIKTWTFKNGLPVKWSGPTLNAQDSAISIETLEIAHEQLDLMLSPGAQVDQLFGDITDTLGF